MKNLFLAFALALSSIGTAQAHLPSSVTKIYEYSCQKRFLEGEGVGPQMLSCVPYQHLGFYLVNQTFYLYQNSNGSNFGSQGRVALYNGDICGIGQLDSYTCEANPHLAFGVSEFNEGPFVAKMHLTASPQGFSGPVGFVALPDRVTGACPEGLEKSFVYGAKFGLIQTRFPTNLPRADFLDNYTIRPAQENTEMYDLTRIPALTPCASTGFCRWPDGRPYTAASTSYVPESGAFCVIPVDRLTK